MTQRQSAIVLTLLAALYGSMLVLFAPELDFFNGETDFYWFPGVVAGLVVAGPAFLALWAVHGRQRAAVRVPLTAWLCSMYFLAAVYGEVRYFGAGESDLVLLILVVWATGYVADLLLLRLLRAVRGWRLERINNEPSAVAAEASQPLGRPKQFTIRTPLVWTAAVAALFAGLRWLTPYGVFDESGLAGGALDELVEGVLLGLIFALAGLPVVSVCLIILTDGRRTIWRCVLASLTALGVWGGLSATRLLFADDEDEIVMLGLAIETGVLLAGVAAASLTRACGYRLARGHKALACGDVTPTRSVSEGKSATPSLTLRVSIGERLLVSTPRSPLGSPSRSRRFAFVLAPLVTAALLLACYAPRRLETWRRADEAQRWELLGWHVEFDEQGHVARLTSLGEWPTEETVARIGQLSHLKFLQLSDPEQSDVLLAALPPLPELETMIVYGASDANFSNLERFPNLESLIVCGEEFTDAALPRLTTLTKLKDLCLVETGVLLEEVPPLPQLKSLNLKATRLGDAGLSHLDRVANLQTLNLCHTNVTDRGLVALRGLKSLTTLNLRMTDISDDAVPALAGLRHLRSLDLELTAVSEAGFVKLRHALPDTAITVGADDTTIEHALFAVVMTSFAGQTVTTREQVVTLKHLHARGSHLTGPAPEGGVVEKPNTVTDGGLDLLTGQTTMEELDLRDSAVTDAGLKSLATLTSLKRLDLRGTRVTEPACQRLAKTLPNCEILR